MKIKSRFLIIFFLLSSFAYSSIKLLEDNQTKFSFEWTTDNLKIIEAGKNFSIISFDGDNIDLGENGEPIIPAFSFYIGTPLNGIISIKVEEKEISLENIKLPPRKRDSISKTKRYPDLQFNQQWISEPQYTQVGRINSARFILRPIIYDENTNILKILKQGRITIEFAQAPFINALLPQIKSDMVQLEKRLILNYQTANGFESAKPKPKKLALKQYPLYASQGMIGFTIGDGHSGLNEGTIEENGLIKISASNIIKHLGTNLQIDNIALFTSYKGALPAIVPTFDKIPDGIYELPLLKFDVNNNGVADSNDYFIAYVSSISDWYYDTLSKTYYYNLDPYDDFRHYFIVDKKTSATAFIKFNQPQNISADTTVSSVYGHVLYKRSVWPTAALGKNGGLEWIWTKLSSYVPVFNFDNVNLINADTKAGCSLMVNTGFSMGAPPLSIFLDDKQICSFCQYSGWYFGEISNQKPKLTLKVDAKTADSLEIKQIEFKYIQKLDLTNINALTVFSLEKNGLIKYILSGLNKDFIYILRISNFDESIMLLDTIRNKDTYEWIDTGGIGIRYYICKENAIKNFSGGEFIPPKTNTDFLVRDLRNLSVPIDYLIVTHPEFSLQAQRLARHKMNIGSFVYPKVVLIKDIYEQFSGGNVDPSALRNAILYIRNLVLNRWNISLDYIVLMGSGHYDYRNISTTDTSFLPVGILRDKNVEDFFVYLTAGLNPESPTIMVPSCIIGRIPCKTSYEAALSVDKIIQTEDPSSADFSEWRNRILLVADDDMQGYTPDQLSTQHLESTERIDTIITYLRPSADLRKVISFEYQWNNNREKPEASLSLINGINNGTAIVNYFGHGSEKVWADEAIFTAEDVSRLQNYKQYPLICSFSCSVGKFDMIGKIRSLAEYCVLAPKSGAIASISSTREAYASDNEKLARNLFTTLFDTTDTSSYTFGQGLTVAKILSRDDNQMVYSYLGDPSIKFLKPDRKIKLSITDENGNSVDTIKALMHIVVKGTILDKNENVDIYFGTQNNPANVFISMFNPPYITTRKDGGSNTNFKYKMPGIPLFTGKNSVVNGQFEQHILIPKNVTFDTKGAKITAYAWTTKNFALGYHKDFIFHGFSNKTIFDTIGPNISVRPVYKNKIQNTSSTNELSKTISFTDKIVASLPFTMEIMLFDSNGIDIISQGPDEGLTFEIPTVIPRKNINYMFQYTQGDYRKGTAVWTFNEGSLLPGKYDIIITAQDLIGNFAKKTISLQITTEQELNIYHVFSYPNPVKMGETSRFYFDLSKIENYSSNGIKVIIRIFTLSGRIIRVIENAKRGEIFDGRDQMGNLLSPGVYLYQITAIDIDQQKVAKSKIEKLAINPPR